MNREATSYGPNQTKYGQEEADYIQQELIRFLGDDQNDFECMDNFRLARKGDAAEEAEYEEAQRDGCCGSHDIEIGPSPGGHFYLYGFNHGH